MKLIDLLYQTIKSCVWFDREISKEKIKDGSYLTDIDLSTFVANVYSALNNAFSLCLTLNKIKPVNSAYAVNENGIYFISDCAELINVYYKNYNDDNSYNSYTYLQFEKGVNDNEYYVRNVPSEVKEIYFEYIKEFPLFDSTYNDVELKDFGISSRLAMCCSKYASAELYDGIDQNVSYIRVQVAISTINALPDYDDAKIHHQESIEGFYYG